MLYIAVGLVMVAGAVGVYLLTKGVPAKEPREWQANPDRVLSATLDNAFTRF